LRLLAHLRLVFPPFFVQAAGCVYSPTSSGLIFLRGRFSFPPLSRSVLRVKLRLRDLLEPPGSLKGLIPSPPLFFYDLVSGTKPLPEGILADVEGPFGGGLRYPSFPSGGSDVRTFSSARYLGLLCQSLASFLFQVLAFCPPGRRA